MKVELRTVSTDDRIKLLHWLEASVQSFPEDWELKEVIDRLQREITYLQTKKIFKEKKDKDPKEQEKVEKEIEETFGLSQKDIDEGVTSYIKQLDERWQKALATYHFMMKGKYDDAITFLKDHSIEDEALAYGKDSDYGGKICKSHLKAIQDMFIEFIHQKARNLADHELYNDYIDDWYFEFGNKEDAVKYGEKSNQRIHQDYFFPSEVFLIKLDNDYYYYSETNGQGTSFVLGIYGEEELKKLADAYGKTVPELKHVIAYDFDKIIAEDENDSTGKKN